jgi:hypothetical protein
LYILWLFGIFFPVFFGMLYQEKSGSTVYEPGS